jgi:hypothetical protein
LPPHGLKGNAAAAYSWKLPLLLSIDILYAAFFWRFYQAQSNKIADHGSRV